MGRQAYSNNFYFSLGLFCGLVIFHKQPHFWRDLVMCNTVHIMSFNGESDCKIQGHLNWVFYTWIELGLGLDHWPDLWQLLKGNSSTPIGQISRDLIHSTLLDMLRHILSLYPSVYIFIILTVLFHSYCRAPSCGWVWFLCGQFWFNQCSRYGKPVLICYVIWDIACSCAS